MLEINDQFSIWERINELTKIGKPVTIMGQGGKQGYITQVSSETFMVGREVYYFHEVIYMLISEHDNVNDQIYIYVPSAT